MHLQNNYKCILRFWNGSELEFSWSFMLHCIYTENFELAQAALKEKSTSRILISGSFTHPHVIQNVHVFLSSVAKKLSLLWKTIQDFSSHSGLLWWPTDFAVWMQLQRALHNPSWTIRVLSSKTICYFLKKIKCIYFLTTHACLTLALWCACASSCITLSCWKRSRVFSSSSSSSHIL